eukprot:9902336-Karenia_brevis.AAC.1
MSLGTWLARRMRPKGPRRGPSGPRRGPPGPRTWAWTKAWGPRRCAPAIQARSALGARLTQSSTAPRM